MRNSRRSEPLARYLFTAWSDVEQRVRRATRLAVFADFDGTLTPIQRQAEHVRLPSGVRHVLSRLVAKGHVVGIVSGRALEDLEGRVAMPGLWYVGDHGFLLKGPGQETVVLVDPHQRATMARVAQWLRDRLSGLPGLRVEEKVATLAVHYRGAPSTSRHAAAEAVAVAVAGEPLVRLMPGKKVWEVVPIAPVDKLSAVVFILRWEIQRTGADRWLPIYIGDDIADERVFSRWEGLSFAVGDGRDTAAQYYVRSPTEVLHLLESLTHLVT